MRPLREQKSGSSRRAGSTTRNEILIRGRSLRVNHSGAKPIQHQDYRFSLPLPASDYEVELRWRR